MPVSIFTIIRAGAELNIWFRVSFALWILTLIGWVIVDIKPIDIAAGAVMGVFFFIVAIITWPNFRRGVVSVVAFIVTMEALYWANTPLVRDAIVNFPCQVSPFSGFNDC